MKVVIDKTFEKDIKKLKDVALNRKVAVVLEVMLEAEDLKTITGVKKLQGSDVFYRIRIGNFRLGFVFENETATMVRCLHRKDIYKYFPK